MLYYLLACEASLMLGDWKMCWNDWTSRSSVMHAWLGYLNVINNYLNVTELLSQFIHQNPLELHPSSIEKITFVNCAIWRSEFNITQQ